MTQFKILPNGLQVDEYCQDCGAWKDCKSPRMRGEGADKPTWLFVAEAPGVIEDVKGIPQCGEAGFLLRSEIEKAGIDINRCRFSQVVMCHAVGGKPTTSMIEHCRPHILREIRSTNPKVVVLLGQHAINSILHKTGVLKWHGEVFQFADRHYVCSFGPGYLQHNDTEDTRALFRRMLDTAKQLGSPKKFRRQHEETKVEVIKDRKHLQEVTDEFKKYKLKAADIEGSTLSSFSRKRKPEVGCVGFSASKERAVVYPVFARVGYSHLNYSPEEALEAVAELWEDPECEYIMHFGKYDYSYMAVLHGIWMQGFMKHKTGYSYDTGQMSYCLKGESGGHGLKEWAWRLHMGGYELAIEEYERTHSEANRIGGNLNLVPGKLLYPYNGRDCIATYRLFPYLRKRLKEKKLWDNPFLFPQMYHNWTAAMLEIKGINTDLDRNKVLKKTFPINMRKEEDNLLKFKAVQKLLVLRRRKFVKKATERVYSYKRKVDRPKKLIRKFVREYMRKNPLNWTPDDRRTLVFTILKYPVIALTKPSKLHPDGQPVCNKKVIAKLLLKRKKNVVLEALQRRGLWYYGYTKYVKPLPSWVGTDGRTHTNYNPAGMRTGRVSSSSPNHENIPKREKTVAPLIRSQFVPTNENHVFLAADEKQMELRLLCDRAGDEAMRREFELKKDPHRMGAAAAFEIPEADVTKEQRTDAKSAVSFGVVYGRSDDSLAADFGKPVSWATTFKQRYFAKYKRIPEYWRERENFARKHGYIDSFMGRIRYTPGIYSDQKGIYNKAVRIAINTPIQSDASDLLWTAGWRMQRWLNQYKLRSKAAVRSQRFLFYRKSRPAIHIHDDITVDCYLPELQDVIEKLYLFMTDRKWIEERTGWFCTVPLDIDVSLCRTHLGESVELERKGDDFVIPKEYK